MSIHNLPNLRARHGVKVINKSGQWTSSDVNLETVAAALPVDPDVAFVDPDEPIRAIPDPWAQATAFGQALLKASTKETSEYTYNGLTRRALGQWRGLLAILALQHQHPEFSLRPQSVDLGDDSPLAEVLTTLTPEIAINGVADLWHTPTLVMLRLASDAAGMFEQPLAMTNPICLVSPGRSTHKLIVPNMPWAQGNLSDPLAEGAAKLSVKELSTLYHFVAGLAQDMGTRSGTIASDMTRLLTSYVSDIQSALNRRHPDTMLAPVNQYSKEPLPFKLLWNNYKIDESKPPPGGRKSEAVIKARGAQLATGEASLPGGHIQGFVLVDPAVADAYGKDPSDILIWGRTDLASLLKSKGKLEAVRTEAAAEGFMVVTADDLLTDRAARLKKRPLIRSHPDGLQDMVLPVRPLTLLLVSDLKAAVTGDTAGDRATVTLNLRLDDGTNDGCALQLTRHYTHTPVPGTEHLLVEAEDWDIYNCQVWPNFRSSVWNIYLARFLYSAGQMGKITRPIHALSAELLRQEIAKAGDCANAARALKQINAGQKGQAKGGSVEAPLFRSAERRTGKNNGFLEETQFSNRAFDAIHYVEALGDARPEAPVGLVLVDTKPIVPPTSPNNVAIDFGTTNTVAAIGSMSAPPVTFQNRLVLPIRHADEMVHDIALHNVRQQFTDFLPPEERGTPIPTVAIPKLPIKTGETLWAFRNLIFFYTAQPPAEGAEEAELNDFLETTRDARFNLKWSPVREVQEAAKDFLTQFMVMTAAELLESGYDPAASTWYFSVPEALSPEARKHFHERIIESARAIGQSEESTYPPLLSEGLAAGRYMLSSGQFTPDKLNVILDIGGGTTDITIWNLKQPIWRGSFKLAGSNFFTTLLVQNTYILEAIGLSGWGRSLDAFAKQPDSGAAEGRRKDMAEMLFSGRSTDSERPDLQKAMTDFWGRLSSTDGEPLRFAALTYLGGIAWYVGKVVRQLMIDGKLGAYETEDEIAEVHRLVADPAFAVCGRGGGIFKMMHGRRKADEETIVTKALKVFGRSVAVVIDDRKHPRFSSSDAPKLEVVRGMLGLPDANAEKQLKADVIGGLSNIMPAGLQIKHGDGQIEADDQINGASLPTKVRSVDMSEFEAFLVALEACTGIAIELGSESSESAHRQIAAQVGKRMKEMRDEFDDTPANQRDRVGIEPPFVIALRKLVDTMALAADDREDLLKVWGAA